MNSRYSTATTRLALRGLVGLLVLLLPAMALDAASLELPQHEGKPVLARINGEPVHLEELFQALATAHEEITAQQGTVARRSPDALLDRLITTRLIVQEARSIGLDELPEMTERLDSYRREALKSLLFGRYARDLAGPSKEEIDARYRGAYRVVEMRTVLVEDEEDALMLEAAVRSGDDFASAAQDLVASGRASGGDAGKMRAAGLLPEIDAALEKLEVGEVSPPVRIDEGYAMVQLLGIEFPDDAQAREQVAADARKELEMEALRSLVEELIERHATVNRELVDSLDFHADQPGFESFLEDTRVIAEIEGAESITVGALAQAVSRKLYHGTERAIEAQRLNKRKNEVLNEIVSRRVVQREALLQELDRLPIYRERLAQFEAEQLFMKFVERVIDPDLDIAEQDLLDYLEANSERYSAPEMGRIVGLIFARREDAEAALARMRQGADFQWLAENAAGRLPRDDTGTSFDGRVLVTQSLPEGARKALEGVASGEARIWAESAGRNHLLWVRELIPASPARLDAVREDVAREVVLETRKQAVELYAAKLREASEVEIYAQGEALLEILTRERAAGM